MLILQPPANSAKPYFAQPESGLNDPHPSHLRHPASHHQARRRAGLRVVRLVVERENTKQQKSMKELFTIFAVICLAAYLALTEKPDTEPDNFARIVQRYERLIVLWIIIAASGWILAGVMAVRCGT